jgi:5-methylcytosine-specific restriction protein A
MDRIAKPWQHTKESRHARGYGSAWDKLRVQVLRRDNGLCQCWECKRTGRIKLATQVDHIVPKSKGGTDAMENLQSIAADCHADKTLAEIGKARRTEVGRDGWPVAG